jgi:exonuclease VII large subunit
VEELKSRLPKVHSEYQALVDQQLLDPQTVQQALQRTEQALNANNLADAQAHLQALDDARIQVMEQLESQWTAQIQYVQERLNALKDCLPQAVSQDLQASINQAHTNWRQLSNADLEALHQKISEFEAQADRIQEAAENLVKAWTEVGYVARILPGTSNGDVMIEVETHEGANTQMRVQFDGQQIELEGPPEERESCARRPQEVMQIFQEQGYQLEWTRLDDQPVTEELLQSYLGTPQEESNEEESIERATESYTPESSQRRLESQGY